MEHLVGDREGLGERRVSADRCQQAIVRYGDQRVDRVLQLAEPLVGLAHAEPSLETEGFRYDGHGERAELRRQPGDHRRPAGRGAASEAARHENHVGALENVDDLFGALERRLATDLGVRTGAETAGQAGAELQLCLRRVGLERLQVGVGGHEVDAAEASAHHPVDRVAAPSANADDLDLGTTEVGVGDQLDRLAARQQLPLDHILGLQALLLRCLGGCGGRCRLGLGASLGVRGGVRLASQLLV